MVDRELIERHLQNMEEALANLVKYADIPLSKLRSDLSLIWIVERGLEILIQNVLDIGAHILASDLRNDWDDYGEILLKLGEHGVIPDDFSKEILGMAGLRNILVHEYARTDVGKLHHYLAHRLPDFTRFMAFVQTYLERTA